MNSASFAHKVMRVIVTNVTYRGEAFATTDDGQGVYIMASLVDQNDVEAGQERVVRVVPNSPRHVERGVQWRAFFVEALKAEAAAPIKPERPREDIVVEALQAKEMMCTGDVADLLGIESGQARVLMDTMHRKGLVVRADVFARHDQATASKAVWALDVDMFSALDGGDGE